MGALVWVSRAIARHTAQLHHQRISRLSRWLIQSAARQPLATRRSVRMDAPGCVGSLRVPPVTVAVRLASVARFRRAAVRRGARGGRHARATAPPRRGRPRVGPRPPAATARPAQIHASRGRRVSRLARGGAPAHRTVDAGGSGVPLWGSASSPAPGPPRRPATAARRPVSTAAPRRAAAGGAARARWRARRRVVPAGRGDGCTGARLTRRGYGSHGSHAAVVGPAADQTRGWPSLHPFVSGPLLAKRRCSLDGADAVPPPRRARNGVRARRCHRWRGSPRGGAATRRPPARLRRAPLYGGIFRRMWRRRPPARRHSRLVTSPLRSTPGIRGRRVARARPPRTRAHRDARVAATPTPLRRPVGCLVTAAARGPPEAPAVARPCGSGAEAHGRRSGRRRRRCSDPPVSARVGATLLPLPFDLPHYPMRALAGGRTPSPLLPGWWPRTLCQLCTPASRQRRRRLPLLDFFAGPRPARERACRGRRRPRALAGRAMTARVWSAPAVTAGVGAVRHGSDKDLVVAAPAPAAGAP